MNAPTPWPEGQRSTAGAAQVSIAWLVERPTPVRLIDVRESHEYRGPLGHIEGAELVPISKLEARAKGWSPDTALVLICRSGGRSDWGALALEQAGFSQVGSMTGGMLAWNAQGRVVSR